MGPASVSLPDPFPRGPRVTPSLLQNTSRTGVSRGWADSPAPPHTQTGTLSAWHHCLPPSVGPVGNLSAEGLAPFSQQRQGKTSLPVRETGSQGRMLPPTPPAAFAQGAPSTLFGSVSLHLAGPWAAPAQGSVGSCYSVPNPTGHRAIYLDVGPAPPLTSTTLSTSGKAALYAHLPPLSVRPGPFSSLMWA